jgi:hypothetical protein
MIDDYRAGRGMEGKVMAILRYCAGIYHKELRKNHKKVSG